MSRPQDMKTTKQEQKENPMQLKGSKLDQFSIQHGSKNSHNQSLSFVSFSQNCESVNGGGLHDNATSPFYWKKIPNIEDCKLKIQNI